MKLLKVFCYSKNNVSDKFSSNRVQRNFRPISGKIPATILVLTLVIGLAGVTSLETCRNLLDIEAKLSETVQDHKNSFSAFKFGSLNYRDVMISDPILAPRKTCAENNGDYDFFLQALLFHLGTYFSWVKLLPAKYQMWTTRCDPFLSS